MHNNQTSARSRHKINIAKQFDHLIKFQPTFPEEPHTEEEHREIATYNVKLQELMKREQK